MEKTPDGTIALVATASSACAYLGRLDVGFDKSGVAREWRGGPILLDKATFASLNAPQPDDKLAQIIEGFAAPVREMRKATNLRATRSESILSGIPRWTPRRRAGLQSSADIVTITL